MPRIKYLVNNPMSEDFGIPELQVRIPSGVHDLFELNPKLTMEKIKKSAEFGTLKAAYDNGFMNFYKESPGQRVNVLVKKPPEPQVFANRSKFVVKKVEENPFEGEFDFFKQDKDDIAAKDLSPIVEEEIKPVEIKRPTSVVFTPNGILNQSLVSSDSSGDSFIEEIPVDLKSDTPGAFSITRVGPEREKVDSFISVATTMKPVEAQEGDVEQVRQFPPTRIEKKADLSSAEKIKNDVKMGYRTCAGKIADGGPCKRMANPKSDFCGLHDGSRKKNKKKPK